MILPRCIDVSAALEAYFPHRIDFNTHASDAGLCHFISIMRPSDGCCPRLLATVAAVFIYIYRTIATGTPSTMPLGTSHLNTFPT